MEVVPETELNGGSDFAAGEQHSGDAAAPSVDTTPDGTPENSRDAAPVEPEMAAEQFVIESPAGPEEDEQIKAVIEAVVYITDEPLSSQQIAAALNYPIDRVKRLLDELTEEFNKPGHGVAIREVAGGYKMATKPEYHEAIRSFVKSLKAPLKLSLAALETLAVIAYKQPVTGPEIMEIRGVQGLGVLKTLMDRKLITTAGRKQVIGKPILYRTTKDFLVQFGLKDLSELPTLKEFEELSRVALADDLDTAAETAASGDSTSPAPPVREPGPEPEPERDPEPGDDPGSPTDPENNPVKAEQAAPEPEPDAQDLAARNNSAPIENA